MIDLTFLLCVMVTKEAILQNVWAIVAEKVGSQELLLGKPKCLMEQLN